MKFWRVMRDSRMANCPKEKRAMMRKGQLFSPDFTVNPFADVEFWLERLPALLGSAPRLAQGGCSHCSFEKALFIESKMWCEFFTRNQHLACKPFKKLTLPLGKARSFLSHSQI